jgi:hypothetical protein
MKLPEFSAERSIYRSSAQYRARSGAAARGEGVYLAHSAGGPLHTDTRCYGAAMFCQDCNFDVCWNWYFCGLCFGFWW